MNKKIVGIIVAVILVLAAVFACIFLFNRNEQAADDPPIQTQPHTPDAEGTIETPPKPTDNIAQDAESNMPPEQSEAIPNVSVRDLFTDVSETVYAVSNVNIRSEANDFGEKLGQLKTAESILRVGIGTEDAAGWSEVVLADGTIAYINSSYLSTTKPAAKPPTAAPSTPPANQPSTSGGITGGNSAVDANGDGFPDSWKLEDPDDGSGAKSILDDEDLEGAYSDTDHDYSGIFIH